jgi:hypothetical protein
MVQADKRGYDKSRYKSQPDFLLINLYVLELDTSARLALTYPEHRLALTYPEHRLALPCVSLRRITKPSPLTVRAQRAAGHRGHRGACSRRERGARACIDMYICIYLIYCGDTHTHTHTHFAAIYKYIRGGACSRRERGARARRCHLHRHAVRASDDRGGQGQCAVPSACAVGMRRPE